MRLCCNFIVITHKAASKMNTNTHDNWDSNTVQQDREASVPLSQAWCSQIYVWMYQTVKRFGIHCAFTIE